MRDRDDRVEASRGEGPPPERRKARKPRDRGTRKTPRQRPSFLEEEEERTWEDTETEADTEEELAWAGTVASAEKIEAEGSLLEGPAAEELAARDAELERFEGGASARAKARVSARSSERETRAPVSDDELSLPGRRVRRTSGGGGGTRQGAMRGIPLALPLALLTAVITLVVTILFTRVGKIDYSNFVFWLVVFTLAAHLRLELKGGGAINLGLAPLLGALIALPVSLSNVDYSKISAAGCMQVVWIFLFGTIITLVTRMFGELSREDVVGMLMEFTGVGVTAWVFYGLMNLFPQKPELLGHYTPSLLVSVAISAGLIYLFYLGKSSYVQAEQGYFSPGLYLRSILRKSWFPFLIVGFTGTLMGLIFVGIGMWWMLFALPLLLVFAYAYHRVAATELYLIETIRVLSAIPEETGLLDKGHGERVARLSEGIARELGLSPEDVKQVEYAAYLHDIGAITRKRGEKEQQQLLEVEGVIAGGVDILGQVDYLGVAAEILRGREGLRDRVPDVGKRRAVSVGAGILRAVDDFESLMRGGKGREPLSENAALTEMNLERGVRYDSKVLRAIARVYPRLPKEVLTPVVGGSTEDSEFWSEQ